MPWDLCADRPIYVQIMEEIERRIITGIYVPGSKLPSVRELAVEAGVNPNTMQKALAEMEQGGLIRTERTAGRFLTEEQHRIEALRKELLQKRMRAFLTEMQSIGVGVKEIEAWIQRTKEDQT